MGGSRRRGGGFEERKGVGGGGGGVGRVGSSGLNSQAGLRQSETCGKQIKSQQLGNNSHPHGDIYIQYSVPAVYRGEGAYLQCIPCTNIPPHCNLSLIAAWVL